MWQLQRADEVRALQAAIAAQARHAPLQLDAAAFAGRAPAELRWRPVLVRGRWDDRYQVLLDNRVSGGQAGYLVYTPLLIDGCACAVLVNRGWVPLGADRQAVPEVVIAAAPAQLSGTLAPPPAAGTTADAGVAEVLAPALLRVQRLDLAGLSRSLGRRLLPLTLQLDPAAPDGFVRNWAPPRGRADRHTAYAVQWFLLAAVTAVLLVALNFRRR